VPDAGIFDIHCHVVPPATRELLAASPDVTLEPGGVRRGQAVLPLPPALSDLTAFDAYRAGLAGALVAPPPALYLEEAPQLAARINDDIADFAASRPGVGVLAWLPVGTPAAALAEVDRLAGRPGVVGFVIGSALGTGLADAALDPVWAVVGQRGLGVFLHPDSDPFDPLCRPLPNPSTAGFPAATTAAVLALLTRPSGLWASGVRLCLSHGGGFLALAIERLARAEPARAAQISARLAQVWVDSVVFGAAPLAAVADCFGPDRVLSGSDWPFPLRVSPEELAGQRSSGPVAGSAQQWCPRIAGLPAAVGT
jgi:predicted TIM-barrel fold metal-dependent hydrolase